MEQFNVITGLPRSGSTLLCNILNQNPDFQASSTSGIPYLLNQMRSTYSTMPEFKSEAINDQSVTEERIRNCMQAVVENWYSCDEKVVFDKSRLWSHHAHLLRELFPESKIIVTIRDLRDIFASIAKQDEQSPLWQQEPGLESLALKAEQMFSMEGIIGQNIQGIDDLVNRKIPQVLYVKFDQLLSDPLGAMKGVHEFLELNDYEYNFSDVQDTATDIDALYAFKFPHHNHGGNIRAPQVKMWEDVISDRIADQIVNLYPDFFKMFRY